MTTFMPFTSEYIKELKDIYSDSLNFLFYLKTQDIERLIVFVDGLREDVDVELVERRRASTSGVDWVDKELHLGGQNREFSSLNDNVGRLRREGSNKDNFEANKENSK